MERIYTKKKNTQTLHIQPSEKTVNAILAYAAATAVLRRGSNVFCVTTN